MNKLSPIEWVKGIASLLLLVVCMIVMAYLLGFGPAIERSATELLSEPPPPPREVSVSSIEFCMEYRANEIAADLKYKGALVTLEGNIADIGRGHLPDDFSKQAVMLDLWSALVDCGEYDSYSAKCYMKDGQDQTIAALRRCEDIIVRGICIGKEFGNPKLTGCVYLGKAKP